MLVVSRTQLRTCEMRVPQREKAKQVSDGHGLRTLPVGSERLGFAGPGSEDERTIHVETGLGTDMFDATAPFATQHVEAQRVACRINDADKPGTQGRPLRGIEIAFEDGVLNALAPILAGPRDGSQAPATFGRVGRTS